MTPEEKRKDYKLRSRYGMSLLDYYQMISNQDGKCAICGKHQNQEKKAFAVDHNHKTGYVRGLLCSYCNTNLLKYLRDDKSRAIGLMNYLQDAIWNDKQWEEGL